MSAGSLVKPPFNSPFIDWHLSLCVTKRLWFSETTVPPAVSPTWLNGRMCFRSHTPWVAVFRDKVMVYRPFFKNARSPSIRRFQDFIIFSEKHYSIQYHFPNFLCQCRKWYQTLAQTFLFLSDRCVIMQRLKFTILLTSYVKFNSLFNG